MRYLKDIMCYIVPIQTKHYAFVVKSELWPFTKLFNERPKPLLSVYLENHLLYLDENLCMIRPKLADDPALLYCMFDDPWESYCPWNFIIL